MKPFQLHFLHWWRRGREETFACFRRRLNWFSLSNQWVHWIAIDTILISFLCLITSWKSYQWQAKKHLRKFPQQLCAVNFPAFFVQFARSFYRLAFVRLIERFRRFIAMFSSLFIHPILRYRRRCVSAQLGECWRKKSSLSTFILP